MHFFSAKVVQDYMSETQKIIKSVNILQLIRENYLITIKDSISEI